MGLDPRKLDPLPSGGIRASGSPCSKTRPRNSDLRGPAAPPAGRTARRPAPAPRSPWCRGPAPREQSPNTEVLAHPLRTSKPRKGLLITLEGPAKFTFGSRGRQVSLPSKGRGNAGPPQRDSDTSQRGPHFGVSTSPAPPTGLTAQAQTHLWEVLWGWGVEPGLLAGLRDCGGVGRPGQFGFVGT